MNKIVYGSLIAVFIAVGIWQVQPTIGGDSVFEQLKKYDYVFQTAYRNYVDEVDPEKLTEAAIQGMLDELDVHSVYITADEMKGVDESFTGHFFGIGVEFDIINDTVTIISPLDGGPSAALGIQAGDKIVTIDDEDAVGIPRSDVPKKLKGPKDTKVKIEVFRRGEPKLLTYNIIRDKIPLNSVTAKYMVPDTDIGVVSISRFAGTTFDELIDALNELAPMGMQKLVLDLRGNPGGYLTQAFKIANEFLPANDTIVFTKSRDAKFDEVYLSQPGGQLLNYPVIVLINQGSASASEIVSGALQDHDRGLIVGTTSFGKGLVQRQYKNGDGSAFRITISKYYTPSGRSIQRPYEDADDYRNLVGRLDLEEGNYFENGLSKIKAAAAKDSTVVFDSLPIYRTDNGRSVLGGGGITPDYIINPDTSRLSDLSVDFRRNRMLYELANEYLRENEKSFESKYARNFDKFNKDFKVDSGILKMMKKKAESLEIEWSDDDYQKDKEWIELEFKSNIARVVWDRDHERQVLIPIDRQLNQAVTLFPKAIELAKNQ
ncbi:MAG: S41 family peptidase [Candidatus Kapaibacteriales bacterium]